MITLDLYASSDFSTSNSIDREAVKQTIATRTAFFILILLSMVGLASNRSQNSKAPFGRTNLSQYPVENEAGVVWSE
jgi:hypothetical protein